MKGSITVETALVFPICIFLMAAIIIMGILERDRVVAQSIVDKYTGMARDVLYKDKNTENGMIDYDAQTNHSIVAQVFDVLSGEYEDKLDKVEDAALKELKDDLLICDVGGVDAGISTGNIILQAKLTNRLNRFMFVNLISADMYVSNRSNMFNESEIVRISDRIWRKKSGD